jgi:hypothetical protein
MKFLAVLLASAALMNGLLAGGDVDSVECWNACMANGWSYGVGEV